MEWKLKTFDELTNKELYAIIKERVSIFVVEQNCPYMELDNFDQGSHHLFLQEGNEIIAYCRILPKGLKYEMASIGRVIVKHTYRRKGIATELLHRSISYTTKQLKEQNIQIQAQNHLRDFYGSFGFKAISEIYEDDGIPHVDMVLET